MSQILDQITAEKIAAQVADQFGVDVSELFIFSKYEKHSGPRREYIHRLYKAGFQLKKIAEIMQRNPSQITSSLKTYYKKLAKNER